MLHATTGRFEPNRFLLLLALAAPVAADTTQVGVGGGFGFAFSPKHVSLLVGDSVTWSNLGGFHNVSSDSPLFRCANGCDQTGGDGAVANAPWAATFQFNGSGFRPYHCEAHGAPGGIDMSGTVTVRRVIFDDGFESGNPDEWVPLVAGSNSCADAVNATGGIDASHTLAGAQNDLDLTASASCGGEAAHGRDRVYRVDSPGGVDLHVTVTPVAPGFDPVIYVITGDHCPNTAAFFCDAAVNKTGPGQPESIDLPTADETYYVVVDTLSPGTAGSGYSIFIGLK